MYLFCFEYRNTTNSAENKVTDSYKLELSEKLRTNIFKWQSVSSHRAIPV